MSALKPYDTLPVADEALDKGGVELLRAGLADDELYVTVRRAFESPEKWGGVLADVTLHLAALYTQNGGLTKDNVIALVAQNFAQSLRSHLAGETGQAAGQGQGEAEKPAGPQSE